MQSQKPALGVMKQAEYDDCDIYIVACNCGCRDADHTVIVEGDASADYVGVTINTQQRWFGFKEKVRAIWRIITRGYVEYETGIVLNSQQASNYANALLESVERIATHQAAKQQPAYELDDGPLTEEEMAVIRAASSASNLPDSRITQHLFDDEIKQ